MAFPGIISRLHLDKSSQRQQLQQQFRQGVRARSEAFWLPTLLPFNIHEEIITLPNSCSLYLLTHDNRLSLRGHDGVLTLDEGLLLENGKKIHVAKELGDSGLVVESELTRIDRWLDHGHQHIISPAALQPVLRAILNIWSLDPYLARHYLTSLIPLLETATEARYIDVFIARERPDIPRSDWVKAYLKLELKLHRAYLEH